MIVLNFYGDICLEIKALRKFNKKMKNKASVVPLSVSYSVEENTCNKIIVSRYH